MAAPRNLTGDGGGRQLVKDEESAAASSAAKGLLNDDSPTGKRTKSERFPLPRWEFAVFFTVFLVFTTGLLCIYLTMAAAEYGKLKVPRTISDLRLLKLPPSCGNLDRSSAVPTLDTSSFLSNHHQENIITDLGSVSAPIGSFHHHQSSAATTTATVGGGSGGSAVELDSYPSFPTLESWKVM